MKVMNLYCKKCNREVPADKRYEEDQFYICDICKTPIGYHCDGCERFFYSNRLVLEGERYICKDCGKPQYGYTRYKKGERT